ncbi:MAG TPA: hypothetical protein VF649_06550 [Sphingomonas sp.]|jgi:hypothetical protein|uniref:hypothetical protein n=1 Tax=Sphingomonas sp. TaxID=28214 RepID=UPI002EDACF55
MILAVVLLLLSAAMAAPPLRPGLARYGLPRKWAVTVGFISGFAGFLTIGAMAKRPDLPITGTTSQIAMAERGKAPAVPVAKVSVPIVSPQKEAYLAQLRREIASLRKYELPLKEEIASKEMIQLQLAAIGAWAKVYADGSDMALIGSDEAERQTFKSLLAGVQKRLFPALRKAEGPVLDKALWESDIDVATLGAGFNTMRFTGGLFAANRNIKSVQDTFEETASLLRFKRVNYEWYRGAGSQGYDMSPIGDDDVASLSVAGWTALP